MQRFGLIKLATKIILLVGVIVLVYFSAKNRSDTISLQSNIEYKNTTYGFSVALPESWNDYSVTTDKWTGNTLGDELGEKVYADGPVISIHNPKWTKEAPYQDIPIMVFTRAQWDELEQGKFHIGAAPIGPSELAQNNQYIFALPARYNYAFPPGYEEVEQILKSKPIKTFQPSEDLTKLPSGVSETAWQSFENGEISFSIPPLYYVIEFNNGMQGGWDGYWYINEIRKSINKETGQVEWHSDYVPHSTMHRISKSVDESAKKVTTVLSYKETLLPCGKRIDIDTEVLVYPKMNDYRIGKETVVPMTVTYFGNDQYTYIFNEWEDERGFPTDYPKKITDTIKFVSCTKK